MAAFLKRLFKTGKSAGAPADSSRSVAKKNDIARKGSTAAAGPDPTSHQDVPVEQVSDDSSPEQIRRLATEGKTAAIRLAAMERIDDESTLQTLQKAAKGRDNGVYQRAKQKLRVLRGQQQAQAERQEELDELIRRAQDQAKTDNTRLYTARTETLQTQWQSIAGDATPEQETAFLTALGHCLLRVREVEAQQAREDEAASKTEEREGTLRMLRSTLDDLRNAIPERGPSLSSLDALQKTQENRWLEATRDTTVERSEQKQYQDLMLQLRQYIAAVQRFETARQTLTEAESNPDLGPQQLREQLVTVDWPSDFRPPALIESLSRRAGAIKQARKEETADQSDQQARLDALLDKLEKELEDNQFRESRSLHKEAQQVFNSLSPQFSRSRQARLTLLGRQLHDLQDWRGFATRPKQEELCTDMEYLAKQHMEPEIKVKHIKELQQAWRNLGGSSDQTLWQRFKQASDEAYAPCDAYFAAKSELKTTNLRKRQAICDQLATFIKGVDWQAVDWRSVERIHRVARNEWREAKPVDFKVNRPVQREFDQLLKNLEAPLNEERQRNEQKKQTIVERAEGLIDHEPLSEATQQAKALQKEWESIGITRRREDRALWQAFRAACDAIFARLDAHKAGQQAERDALIDNLKALTAQAGSLRQDPVADTDEIQTIARQLKQAATPDRLPGELQSALKAEKRALQTLLKQREQQQRIANWLALIDQYTTLEKTPENTGQDSHSSFSAREIVVRVEITTGAPSPEEDQPLRMAQQVNRLASGFGGGDADASADERLDQLIELWCCQPVPENEGASLAERLRQALAQWQSQTSPL